MSVADSAPKPGVDQSAMTEIANEIKALNLDLARQNLEAKKITEPAKSAKALAQNG
jgi:hypothetical protein